MNEDAVLKILTILPMLATDVASAILQILHAPAMTKEQLLAAAEKTDDETLAFLKGELAKIAK